MLTTFLDGDANPFWVDLSKVVLARRREHPDMPWVELDVAGAQVRPCLSVAKWQQVLDEGLVDVRPPS